MLTENQTGGEHRPEDQRGPAVLGRPVDAAKTVYEVRNPDGRLAALHHRLDLKGGRKRVWWTRPDGKPGLNGRRLEELPLYGAEALRNREPDDLVIVVEGEKARDALYRAGFAAVGTVCGASGTPGDEALKPLHGKTVCLWPDKDEAGRAHMERLAAKLNGKAAEVLVYEWHDAPEGVKGADAADHPAVMSADPEAVDRLLQDLMEAPRWEGVTGVTPSYGSFGTVTPIRFIRFSEIAPPGPREYVVEGIIPKDHTTTIFGDGGSAKSILVLSAATAIAGGAARWMGRKIQNYPVLYGDFELDAGEQRRRAYQVARGVHLDKPPPDLLYVSGLGRPTNEVLTGCLDVCVREGVGLFIIDSLGIALEGDAGEARDVIGFHRKYLDPFRENDITLVVVDHQGKTQAGERYQNKRTFGSVYKENLARSVLQVEPGDRGEGLLTVKVRHTKHNFGPKVEPFGARLTFSEKKITVEANALDAADLAQEHTLNAVDRARLALTDGPVFPHDVSEKTGMPLGTVKNVFTALRKRGQVKDTGEVDPHTKARQVQLTEDGWAVTGVTPPIGDGDAVPPEAGSEEDPTWPRHPTGCPCETCSSRDFRKKGSL